MVVMGCNSYMTTDKITDEDLIVIIREKDKEMYAEIIRRYQRKLSHYLRKFIRSHDELEDVLQEVFVKTYRNLNSFDTDKKFSSWIYRIAHNEALNHLKKNKNSISLDEHEFDIVDENFDIKSKIDIKIVRQKIEQAFSQMDEKYREPIFLYFFEQKSYDEISEILHIPCSTVGVLIMRGKSIVKKILEQQHKIYDSK